MKKAALFFLLFASVSFAQLKLEAYAGGSFPISNKPFSNFLSINYYPGINIGAAANYFLLNEFSLSPFAEYTIFLFKNNSSGFAVLPNSGSTSVSGSNTQFYKLGFNVKFFPRFIMLSRGYILTGFTWYGVKPGSIDVIWYEPNKGSQHSSEQIDDKHFISQNFGIGIPIAKATSFEVMIEGLVSTNYTDRFLGSLNLGFYF